MRSSVDPKLQKDGVDAERLEQWLVSLLAASPTLRLFLTVRNCMHDRKAIHDSSTPQDDALHFRQVACARAPLVHGHFRASLRSWAILIQPYRYAASI
jgi:hypothetical protein